MMHTDPAASLAPGVGDDPMDVPGLIRRARRRVDVAQEGLAELLNVSQSTISRWEKGHCQPSLRHFQRLVTLAGLRLRVVDELGDDAEPMTPDGVLDRAGRRHPSHLDVHIIDDGGWPSHKNRPIPEVWCPRRARRDEIRRETGEVPADHPTPLEIEQHKQARRQRFRDERAADRSLWSPRPEEPSCFCLVECWDGRACLTECPCQCEVKEDLIPWLRRPPNVDYEALQRLWDEDDDQSSCVELLRSQLEQHCHGGRDRIAALEPPRHLDGHQSEIGTTDGHDTVNRHVAGDRDERRALVGLDDGEADEHA